MILLLVLHQEEVQRSQLTHFHHHQLPLLTAWGHLKYNTVAYLG